MGQWANMLKNTYFLSKTYLMVHTKFHTISVEVYSQRMCSSMMLLIQRRRWSFQRQRTKSNKCYCRENL